jgi:hypothetical protein
VAGHDASTCTAHDVTSSSRDAPPTEGQVPRTTPDEIAHLDEVIAMQHSALAQHQSAVRHWLAAGDEERADAAAWRADYVGGLLAQLQIDRRALCA